MIVVRAEDWLEVDEADQQEFELAARERGVILAKEGGTARGFIEVVRQGSEADSAETVSYAGVISCTRSSWEHQLRQLLDLEDPCL
jgi:hypothetical protein